MPGGGRDVPAPTANTANPPQPQSYYWIPALRCIADVEGEINTTLIGLIRRVEIDRQRRRFPE